MHIVYRPKGQTRFEQIQLNGKQSTKMCGMHVEMQGSEVQIEKPVFFGLSKRTIRLQPGNSVTVDGHLFFAASTDHAVLRFISNRTLE